MTKNELVGASGEFFALYRFSRLGFSANHMPSTGFDLVINKANKLIRVQVKSRSFASTKSGLYGFKTCKEVGRSGKTRGVNTALSKKECDIVAFVSLDLEKMIIKSVSEIDSLSSYFHRDDFLSKDSDRDIENIILSLC